MPAGTWQRLNIWVETVRWEKEGPLFTRIRRFDTLINERLTILDGVPYFAGVPAPGRNSEMRPA